jgi:hypothetical protein
MRDDRPFGDPIRRRSSGPLRNYRQRVTLAGCWGRAGGFNGVHTAPSPSPATGIAANVRLAPSATGLGAVVPTSAQQDRSSVGSSAGRRAFVRGRGFIKRDRQEARLDT